MKFKKFVFDALIIILAFSLFVFWYERKFNTSPVTISSRSGMQVYLITMDKSIQYWSFIDQGASDMAQILNIDYRWEAPQERNLDEQIRIINNAVNEGVDALLIAAIDPVKTSESIENAKAAGVKIIYVDSPANEEGIVTLATDNFAAGMTAANIMIQELEALGIRKGSIGIIGETPQTPATTKRDQGFRRAINENANYQLLTTSFTNNDIIIAEEETRKLIDENPDLVGIFGTSENTSIGAGNAIKSADRTIIGIGFDYNNAIHDLLAGGYLKAVMVQNPYTMGYLGMAEAAAALRGLNTGPSYINTGVSIRTQYLR